MRGRLKGEQERRLALAHQIEMFARQKTIRALSHYLETEKQKSDIGAAMVLAMFRQLAEKGKTDG